MLADYQVLIPLLIAIASAHLLTKVMIGVSTRLGIVDRPDGIRKLHGRIVPLGGGVAVFLAVVISVGLSLFLRLPVAVPLFNELRFLSGFLLASLSIVGLGLIDDAFQLRGRQKLLGQVVIVGLIALGGLRIDELDLFGFQLELGPLAIPFTMFWLLGAINALNLVDGVDGLASSVGIVMSVSLALLAVGMGHATAAFLLSVLAASLLGFLWFNWQPAKIFLGDAGSMFIGLSLGALAIRSSMKGPATMALVAPTVVMAIPILDVGMAILRRRLTGQSVYATDRGHLHHVLQRSGYGSPGVVAWISLLCAACGVGALLSVFLKSEFAAVASVLTVVITLIVTRSFGHAECQLLFRQSQAFAASFFQSIPRSTSDAPPQICSRFHGNKEWDRLWESMVAYAKRFDLCTIRMNINAPSIGEVYHADWRRKQPNSEHRVWTTSLPLIVDRTIAGKIVLMGVIPDDVSPFEWMSELLEGLRPFEMQLLEILNDVEPTLPIEAPIPTSVR